MEEKEEEKKVQETQIIATYTSHLTHKLIAAAVFVVVVLTAVIVVLTTKSNAKRLAEALSFGEKYLNELDYEQAVVAYQVAIEIDPKCTEAYIGLADTYTAMGDYEEAVKVLEQAEKMLIERENAGENVLEDLERVRKRMEELERLIRTGGNSKDADGSLFIWRENRNGLTITGYKDDLPKDVVIPEKINGVSVTEIAYQVFYGCSSLKSVTIPKSVTKIGNSAFDGIENLEIHGEKGSYAQKYANEYGIPFVEE